jgi:hypothetical protein
MNIASKMLLLLLASSIASSAFAEQPEAMLKVKKSTFVNLVDLLVQRGVINKQEGSSLVTAAEQEAAGEDQRPTVGSVATAKQESVETQTANGKSDSKSKHVSYVPEFVKKELRDQVRAELKAEVVNDVKQDAKTEGWGIPAALPEWIAKINPGFDARVRLSDTFYGSGNLTGPNSGPYNFLNINSLYIGGSPIGMSGAMGQSPTSSKYAYNNNTKDQLMLRERFRLGFEANIIEGVKAGIRLATSNNYNPVSNDQTLGNTGQSYQFAIDRSYLQYDYLDDNKTSWFSVYGGRIINPFLSTDIVFDPDLSFEGVATSFRYHFNQDIASVRGYQASNPTGRPGLNQGQQTPDSVFMTVGVFPVQNVSFSSKSKWLYAGQLGADWLVFDDSRFNIAASYYEYQNISARYNSATGNGHEYDWTAPQFLQQGNSMVAITDSNSFQGQDQVCADPTGCLFGLASGFKIFNMTTMYDYLYSGETHVLFTADYAKNLAYNRQKILQQFTNGIVNYTDSRERTSAYQARIDVGRPKVTRFSDWNLNLAYRYVERDAVLDAFTDSMFHQGGTNAKGWVLGVQYGLAKNTWLDLRWFSADAIDGPKYSVDMLNLDMNTRF